ncbi:hypothetical protein ZEAMMB73_Zm00001d020088 [Zea mays]|uniref:Uncharacterized protein n=1 Tax=Zea mays TaxID=4577 RepID=A0A1D6I225_MAIZE|nr:hypothetical protein ZEAMMB73_Zm00001d020088 [Zea mays]ONM54259.1 hypothetical protein ZEAMMB73_Zm00001d020088 [Zea mays]
MSVKTWRSRQCGADTSNDAERVSEQRAVMMAQATFPYYLLKEEAMLNKVLKETVLSKVVAIDKLQSGLASSLRIQDVMRNEIQRVQDELSCITHKAKQLELQVSCVPCIFHIYFP